MLHYTKININKIGQPKAANEMKDFKVSILILIFNSKSKSYPHKSNARINKRWKLHRLQPLQSFWKTPRLRLKEASEGWDDPDLGFDVDGGGLPDAELCISPLSLNSKNLFLIKTLKEE